MSAAKTYTLQEAAKRIGISAITLKRWLLAGKVDEVARDRNNWRRFTETDIARIRAFASKLVSPGRR